jgi:hypothetical protein
MILEPGYRMLLDSKFYLSCMWQGVLEKFPFWLNYFSLNTVTVENHESRDPFVLKV